MIVYSISMYIGWLYILYRCTYWLIDWLIDLLIDWIVSYAVSAISQSFTAALYKMVNCILFFVPLENVSDIWIYCRRRAVSFRPLFGALRYMYGLWEGVGGYRATPAYFLQSVEHPWSSCNGHGSQVTSQIVRPMSIASVGQTSIVYRLMF